MLESATLKKLSERERTSVQLRFRAMSGHSKWSQIKRQKGATDAKRGVVFTKLANAISAAVRESGKDPANNVRLRLMIEKARALNVPKENIERAIRRGAGEVEGQRIEDVTYEGYGPGGVAVVAEAATDNRNRTTAEVRRAFSEHGGNLGGTNSVLWMFDRRGILEVPSGGRAEPLELAAIDAGATDVEVAEGTVYVTVLPSDLGRVRSALEAAGFPVAGAELSLVPKTSLKPSTAGQLRVRELLEALEDLEDVTNVATNAEL